MVRRAETTALNRRRIELALIGLLAIKPFSAITIGHIAAAAAVSVRTIQRHYASKDNILAACVSFPARALAEELSARPPASSLREALRSLVAALFSFYEANTEQSWAVYSRAQDVPVLDDLRRAAVRSRESLIGGLLERWPDDWATDQRTARAALQGLTAFGTWQALTDGGRFKPKAATKFVVSVLERTLLK